MLGQSKMKMRSTFKAIVVSAVLAGSPVAASEFADRIILWLQEQGFTYFEVKRTWLGRIRIEAHADGIEREIIINGRTGEILRDYWEVEDHDVIDSSFNLLAVPEGMGNSNNVKPVLEQEDDREDDDDEDDEDDEDEVEDEEEDDEEDEEDDDEEEEDDEEDEDDDQEEDEEDEGEDDEEEDEDDDDEEDDDDDEEDEN